MRSVSVRYKMFLFVFVFVSKKYFAACQLGVPCYRHLICDHIETFFFFFLFYLRPDWYQHSIICRTATPAPILSRDIWDNCFCGGDLLWVSELPTVKSPQADSMVLFGAFCNFYVQKKKKKKKPVPKWLEWMYFCLCTCKNAIQKCEQGHL